MHRSLLPMAALALSLMAVPVAQATPVTPPATRFQSSLTAPTPPTGTDWEITKASQVQVSVSSGNVTIKLKLNGVVDSATQLPVNQAGNTLAVDLRRAGLPITLPFLFDLVNGKTVNAQTKFTVANTSMPLNVAPDDSIEVRSVRCLQGGGGPGATNSFCSVGLTVK